jgi:hypothetical protein
VVDHKIQGDILFPAAGMLCAALEAVRQLADETKKIESYEFRDAVFNRALVIPEDNKRILMMLHMKSRKIGTKANDSTWYEFTVFSQLNNEEHVENCSGLIRINYSSETNAVEHLVEAAAECERLKADYEHCQHECKHSIKTKTFYDKWNTLGVQYGKICRLFGYY